MLKSPCLDCKDRELYCHSRCKQYSKYREQIDKIKDIKKKENDYVGYEINNVIKFKKARNLPQYR